METERVGDYFRLPELRFKIRKVISTYVELSVVNSSNCYLKADVEASLLGRSVHLTPLITVVVTVLLTSPRVKGLLF